MAGPFPATVHKLVTLWNPPPSLLQICKKSIPHQGISQNHDTRSIDMQKLLMNAISKLTKHNDLKDNFIRGTHQLDYATSGVLLMAKTKIAAAAACKSFEDRVTKKEYLAIVHGHIDTNTGTGDTGRTDTCKMRVLNAREYILKIVGKM
jgi:23S rRNA-/tRNA-specific pseudouridylate synthase